jgi:hypothetical protein
MRWGGYLCGVPANQIHTEIFSIFALFSEENQNAETLEKNWKKEKKELLGLVGPNILQHVWVRQLFNMGDIQMST